MTALPALQQLVIRMHENCNLVCRRTAMEDVAGIALPFDINQCFNCKIIYLFCASSSLLGSGMITQSAWLIYHVEALVRIMTTVFKAN